MSTWAKLAAAAVAAAASFALLFWWRGFFVQHAALVAIAIGALVYTTLGTSQRLGRTYRHKGPRSIGRRPPDDKP